MLTVEAAAIRINGEIHSLPKPARHEDVVLAAERSTGKPFIRRDEHMGFLLSDGRFASREFALMVAVEAGQLIKKSRFNVLMTEEVW